MQRSPSCRLNSKDTAAPKLAA